MVAQLAGFCLQVLPGNVGRAILGPLAALSAVAALNHRLGVNQPLGIVLLLVFGVWLKILPNCPHGSTVEALDADYTRLRPRLDPNTKTHLPSS